MKLCPNMSVDIVINSKREWNSGIHGANRKVWCRWFLLIVRMIVFISSQLCNQWGYTDTLGWTGREDLYHRNWQKLQIRAFYKMFLQKQYTTRMFFQTPMCWFHWWNFWGNNTGDIWWREKGLWGPERVVGIILDLHYPGLYLILPIYLVIKSRLSAENWKDEDSIMFIW